MMANKNQYPFISKRDIAARLGHDQAFLRECADVLEDRAQQREVGRAPLGKPWGWMSSDRVNAKRLVDGMRADALTEAERSKLQKLVAPYGRQLADHFRDKQLIEHPELVAAARKYGIPVPKAAVTRKAAGPDVGSEEVESAPVAADKEVVTRLVTALKQQPGMTCSELAQKLKTPAAVLSPLLRELIESRRLRKSGIARGTRYSLRL